MLARIDAFRERYGIKETRFGRDAVNDPNILAKLRAGRPALDRTLAKIDDYMRNYPRARGGKPRPSMEVSAA